MKRFFYDKILFIGGLFIIAKEKTVLQVQITEGKRNIIHQLLEECDIQISEDTQDTLNDLLDEIIKEMLESKMN